VKTKILIIEDEKNFGLSLLEFLEGLGHKTTLARNCVQARKAFHNDIKYPDIIIFDIGLPDGNGLELAKELRQVNQDFSFIFLSAMNDPDTRLTGLEVGADDFVIKPFKLKELTLRLNKIINTNKTNDTQKDIIHHGKLSIKFKSYEVIDAFQKSHRLSQKECEILHYLYKNKNIAVKRDEIIDHIWGENQYPSNRTVDNYIVKLRKWCETDSSKVIEILSIRGIGYKLSIRE
jgi:two-component system, OmpR family, alkaline phosphatase synthesis response regulator PhoP